MKSNLRCAGAPQQLLAARRKVLSTPPIADAAPARPSQGGATPQRTRCAKAATRAWRSTACRPVAVCAAQTPLTCQSMRDHAARTLACLGAVEKGGWYGCSWELSSTQMKFVGHCAPIQLLREHTSGASSASARMHALAFEVLMFDARARLSVWLVRSSMDRPAARGCSVASTHCTEPADRFTAHGRVSQSSSWSGRTFVRAVAGVRACGRGQLSIYRVGSVYLARTQHPHRLPEDAVPHGDAKQAALALSPAQPVSAPSEAL